MKEGPPPGEYVHFQHSQCSSKDSSHFASISHWNSIAFVGMMLHELIQTLGENKKLCPLLDFTIYMKHFKEHQLATGSRAGRK